MTFIQEAPFLELATQTVTPGTGKQLIYPRTNGNWYVKDDAGVETLLSTGGSGNAPADATYITQTASSGLSAEQALSSLATGLMQVTTATGVVSSVTTSAGLAALISDETGTGALVFASDPALTGLVTLTTTIADPVATTRALRVTATETLSADNAQRIDGLTLTAALNNATFNATNTTGLIANNCSAQVTGTSGTVTKAVGVVSAVLANAGATLTNAVGVQVNNSSATGGSTLTNAAGVVINSQTGATNNTYLLLGTATIPSGNWGIYSTSANNNSLLGNLGIGLAAGVTPTNPLSLSGQAARSIWMERMTTSNTAGNSLTLQSGGATSGATNKASGALVLATGVGTGNAVPALIELTAGIQSATSGTTDKTQVDRLIVNATKVLTNNSAITILNATLATITGVGLVIRYLIEVTDGTDIQSEVGSVYVSGVNKGGAFTMTITEVSSQQSLSSAATLATTWAVSSANPAAISINANSSLTPSTGYPRITYAVDNFSQQALAVA